ncbi:MAG: CHAD domain-containing protein [Proteobacteria bacterium]|nr:CHAD domain-containing protein [Pseudomonadota bacterium]
MFAASRKRSGLRREGPSTGKATKALPAKDTAMMAVTGSSPTVGMRRFSESAMNGDGMAELGHASPHELHVHGSEEVPETRREGHAGAGELDMSAPKSVASGATSTTGGRRKRIEADAIHVGATVVSSHLARAIAQIPGATIGDDHEFVHRLRVACRRTRVALELWSGPLGQVLGDDQVKRARRGLRDLARSVGAVRDLDVWLLDLGALSARAGVTSGVGELRDRANVEREIANSAFRKHLDSSEVAWLCEVVPVLLKDAVSQEPPDDPVLIGARQQHGRRAIARAVRDLNDAGRPLSAWVNQPEPHSEIARIASFPGAPAHEIRLYAKRARYTAEAFVPAFKDAPEALDAAIASLARIQEKIGDWHDRVGWHERIVTVAKLISARPNAGDDLVGLMQLASQVGRERDLGLEKIGSAWRDRPRVGALRDGLDIRK